MAKDKEEPVYLPRQRTRIGRAGYKGKNVKVYDPETGEGSPEAPAKVVTSVPTETKARAPRASGKAGPKAGIKPLKNPAGGE